MRFEYLQHYAAPPTEVIALLRNREFIAALAARAGARKHAVDTAGGDVTVTMEVDAPQAAASFLGNTLTVVQHFHFSAPKPDGTISGEIAIRVEGAPVDSAAEIILAPEAGGHTSARIAGDLHVRVPLLGRQLERQAEPVVAQGLSEIEATAADWLT